MFDEAQIFNPNKRQASVMEYHLRLHEIVRTVQELSPGPRVADLACGQGNFSLLLAELGFDVTAVDIKPEFLSYLKKKQTSGKVTTVVSNIMDFRSAELFDCVILGEVIEHVAQPKNILIAAARNLKPGGIIIVSTPNGDHYGNELPTYSQVTDFEALIPKQFHWLEHLFLYTETELTGLMEESGIDVIASTKFNSAYSHQIKAIRYLLPLQFLKWLEKTTWPWKIRGKDSTNGLILTGRKRSD